MAKSSRRTKTRTPNEGASRQTGTREAAPSRSVNAMALRTKPFGAVQSKVSFEHRRGIPATQRPRRGVVPSSQDLFGTWELPPPQRPRAKAPAAVSTCVARHTRREVLFANRTTGSGAHAPKLKFSNRKCK